MPAADPDGHMQAVWYTFKLNFQKPLGSGPLLNCNLDQQKGYFSTFKIHTSLTFN